MAPPPPPLSSATVVRRHRPFLPPPPPSACHRPSPCRRPLSKKGEFNSQRGDRCGSDILPKCCGSILGMMPPSTAMSAPAAAVGLHFRKSASVSLCRCLCFPISGPHPSRHCFRILPLTSLPKPLSTIGQDVGSDVRTSSCS